MEPDAAPWISTGVLLAATLVAASLLDYALTRSNDRPSLDDGRVKGDTYFQEVVGEMAAAAGGTEQGCLWSQTDDEVHVSVAMPADARAKDCQCKILESSLSLTIKGSVVLRVRGILACCIWSMCACDSRCASMRRESCFGESSPMIVTGPSVSHHIAKAVLPCNAAVARTHHPLPATRLLLHRGGEGRAAAQADAG